jgi:hypothetical protein
MALRGQLEQLVPAQRAQPVLRALRVEEAEGRRPRGLDVRRRGDLTRARAAGGVGDERRLHSREREAAEDGRPEEHQPSLAPEPHPSGIAREGRLL